MPPSPLPPPTTTETSDGWVKSIDPRTGRPFYANRITRATQWEAPLGWPEPDEQSSSLQESGSGSSRVLTSSNSTTATQSNLPDGWEEMTDPTSGRKFYVDHASKITTWEKPQKMTSQQPPSSSNLNVGNAQSSSSSSYNNWLVEEEAASVAVGYQLDSNVHGTSTQESDILTTTPTPDFVVRKIGDKERQDCPQCALPFIFASRRRHHCRLCGDVFCDECSSHRVALPLDGTEFEKPVRVCDLCNKDIDRGNYFSMRRYLPPLQLHDPGSPNPPSSGEVAGSATHVVAALGGLTSDLESILLDSSSFEEKITIPAQVLVPAICRHIDRTVSQEHAIHALSTLLMIGSLVGTDTFARAVYACELRTEDISGKSVIESILQLLERNSSSHQVSSSQVFAARALFYLTDPKVITKMIKGEDSTPANNGGAAEFDAEIINVNQNETGKSSEPVLIKEVDDATLASKLDVHRALRNVLDHSSASGVPSLQRWAASSIRHLIIEDKRRSIQSSLYQSFIPEISSTGGILILCSLLGANDSDTRTHATAALASIVVSARAIDNHRKAQSNKRLDKFLIGSIVDADGCGSSLSQIMLSSDDTVARMGVSFAASLVSPLIVPVIVKNNPVLDENKTYHNAAFALANNGPCLHALIQILRSNGLKSRSTELMRVTIETLAAICVACCSKSNDVIHVSKIKAVISKLESESLAEAIMTALASSQSLSSKDGPSAQLREALGILTCALCYISKGTVKALMTKRAISSLLTAASDENMQRPSRIRCEKSLRCLPLLEAVSALLTQTCDNTNTISQPSHLDCLLEAIEGGIIPLVSRLMLSKIEFGTQKSTGDISLKIVSCLIVDAIFSIAFYDKTLIGGSRLYGAILMDAESGYRGRGNLISTTISLLHATTLHLQQQGSGMGWFGGTETESDITLIKLEESALLAVGSMCGAVSSARVQDPTYIDVIDEQDTDTFVMAPSSFTDHRHDACIASCGVLFDDIDSSIFATMLVGGFGERMIIPTLRLLSALCCNGPKDLYPKLANNGILIPISDIMRNAMNADDRFMVFASLTLFRYCGPHFNVDLNNGGGGPLNCVRDVIRVAASVIKGEEVNQPNRTNQLFQSKFLAMLEALSGNASLWSAITSEALPALAVFLRINTNYHQDRIRCQSIVSVLRIIQGIIPLPTNASFADRCGVISAIADLYIDQNVEDGKETILDDESYHLHLVGLGVLRILSGYPAIRRGDGKMSPGMVNSGVFKAVCSSLSQSVKSPDSPFTGPIAHVGIELLMDILSDLDNDSDMTDIQKATLASSVVDSISTQSNFVRTLIATMLSRRNISETSISNERIVSNSYGSALVCPDTQCSGYSTTYDAVVACLLTVAEQCAVSGTSSSEEKFWQTFMLEQISSNYSNKNVADVATACSFLLNNLNNDETLDLNLQDSICKDALQSRLLSGLKTSLEVIPNDDTSRWLLINARVVTICTKLCRNRSKSVQVSASTLMHLIGTRFPELISTLATDKLSLSTLFDMLCHHKPSEQFSKIVFDMAKKNLLGKQVAKLNMRKYAIKSLTKGCKFLNEPTSDELRVASFNMGSLVSILQRDTTTNLPSTSSRDIMFEKGEVRQISTSIAAVIPLLISIRVESGPDDFQGAKLETTDGSRSDPEIILLCALASHNEALSSLCDNGAIPALIAVSGCGEISALTGLYEASKAKPGMVIEYEGHIVVSRILTENEEISDDVKAVCLNILTVMCKDSLTRRNTIAVSCDACVGGCINYIVMGESDMGYDSENSTTRNIDPDLVYPVFLFLTEMVLVKSSRDLMLDSPSLIKSIIAMGDIDSANDLNYIIVKFLTLFSPFVSSEDTDHVVKFFVSVLNTEQSHTYDKNKQIPNKNILLSLVTSGLESLMEHINSMDDCVQSLVNACSKRLNALPGTGIYGSISFIKDSGSFILSCTSLFLLLAGSKDGRDSLYHPRTFKLLLDIALVNSKTLPAEANHVMWSTAQVQNLQCLASLTRFRVDDTTNTYAYWNEQISNFESEYQSRYKPISAKNNFIDSKNSNPKEKNGHHYFINMLDEIYHDESSNVLSSIAAQKILLLLG